MEEKTFEAAMHELEAVVQKLESGQLTLDESLAAYKQGMELSHYCKQKLADAKESVVTIMKENEEVNFNSED